MISWQYRKLIAHYSWIGANHDEIVASIRLVDFTQEAFEDGGGLEGTTLYILDKNGCLDMQARTRIQVIDEENMLFSAGNLVLGLISDYGMGGWELIQELHKSVDHELDRFSVDEYWFKRIMNNP